MFSFVTESLPDGSDTGRMKDLSTIFKDVFRTHKLAPVKKCGIPKYSSFNLKGILHAKVIIWGRIPTGKVGFVQINGYERSHQNTQSKRFQLACILCLDPLPC